MVATNYLNDNKKPIMNIGHKIRAALWHAQTEKRLIVGLPEAVKSLSKTPDEYLFCILAPVDANDTSTHIQEVLLEAYCYENDIYILKVDAADKVSRILGIHTIESCVLIQKSMMHQDRLTVVENELVDYCEDNWNETNKKVINLP